MVETKVKNKKYRIDVSFSKYVKLHS